MSQLFSGKDTPARKSGLFMAITGTKHAGRALWRSSRSLLWAAGLAYFASCAAPMAHICGYVQAPRGQIRQFFAKVCRIWMFGPLFLDTLRIKRAIHFQGVVWDRKSNDISVHTCHVGHSGDIFKKISPLISFSRNRRSRWSECESNRQSRWSAAKEMTATRIEMDRILTDRQSFGPFSAWRFCQPSIHAFCEGLQAYCMTDRQDLPRYPACRCFPPILFSISEWFPPKKIKATYKSTNFQPVISFDPKMMLCLVSSLPLLKPARRLDKHHLLETRTFAPKPEKVTARLRI